jgi:histidinol phosphatase-like enzyme
MNQETTSNKGVSTIKDCVFIVKDGVLVDDSIPQIKSTKDLIVFGSAKPGISTLSEYMQVVIVNNSKRYTGNQEAVDNIFKKKLGIFIPTYYSDNGYLDLFDKIKQDFIPDTNFSFFIGATYEDVAFARTIGFREIFLVKTGIRNRDIDEKTRILALDPMPICVDSLWDAVRCIKLAIEYRK